MSPNVVIDSGLVGAGPHWASQVDEIDPIDLVLVCNATLPKSMGALHPAASLFEKPVNTDKITEQHQQFKDIMREHGAKVVDIRDVLKMDVEKYIDARVALEEMAASCLTYKLDAACEGEEEKAFVSEAYKAKILKAMCPDQLVDIIMTNPTIAIVPSHRDTGFTATYSFEPLSNMVFTRDQQITTKKGIVMCHMAGLQRQKEVKIMKFVHHKLGLNVIGDIPEEGRLEGGDFFACGDSCMIGVGLRSNQFAMDYMMDNDLLGYNRVAIVKDELEVSQDRMHLDTYFSILSKKAVIMLEDIIGENSPTRRYVDEYVRENETSPYKLVKKDIEFAKYIESEGYTIIPVPGTWQLQYGCNCLHLGNNTVLFVHPETARLVAHSKCFGGKVIYLDFSAITSMYGAAHCATQVVRRTAQ